MKSPGAAKAWKKAKITLNAVKFKSGTDDLINEKV